MDVINCLCLFLGGGLCCMSSFPYIWDSSGTPKGDARFYMALFGQAITGVACPFVSSVPTKVITKINVYMILSIFIYLFYYQEWIAYNGHKFFNIWLDISTLVWRKWKNSSYDINVDVICSWRDYSFRINPTNGSNSRLHCVDEYCLVYSCGVRICSLHVQGKQLQFTQFDQSPLGLCYRYLKN